MNRFFRALIAPLALLMLVGGHNASAAGPLLVDLGTADGFAVLAGSTITNTGSSIINGNIGSSSAAPATGFPPGVINGAEHAADQISTQAQTDLATAYSDISKRARTTIASELGGTVKNPGVYDSEDGAFVVNGTLTLDAQGDPSAIFIFQTASGLVTTEHSTVVLTGGAQACNVFWQVGGSATIGTNSTFKGNILAVSSASLRAGTNVEGRILVQKGSVTLNDSIITKATCVYPPLVPDWKATFIAAPPLISIKNVPNPLALSAGPGSVTYTYTVLNVGTVPMSDVTVADDKCAKVEYSSGDTNGDFKLDVDETWTYRCITKVGQTTTSLATATGHANDLQAVGNAVATVVVGVPLPPPLIHVIQKPDQFILPFRGGEVTYTYIVTNPGVTPLSYVSVASDTCKSISGPSGDTNSNHVLDPEETWTYLCRLDVTKTTISTVTVEGSANGLTAIGYAPSTVVVAIPQLIKPPNFPNTAAAPPISFPRFPSIPPLPSTGAPVFPNTDATVTNNTLPWVITIAAVIVAFAVLATALLIWAYREDRKKKKKKLFIIVIIGSAVVLVGLLVSLYLIGNFYKLPVPTLPNAGLVGRLKIPSIKLDAAIVSVGLTPDGAMDVAPGHPDVGWFDLGPRAGETGSAVIDGHSGFWLNGKAAVFDNLYKLHKGDTMTVVDEKGKLRTFVVQRVGIFDAEADATDVFTSDGGAHLNLITCYGKWDETKKAYPQRLVVFTDLTSDESAINTATLATSTAPALIPSKNIPGTSFTIKRNLGIGSSGADVTALQIILINSDFLKIAAPTGHFDAATKNAVIAWQKANKISPATGYFGPLSRAKLNSASPTSTLPNAGTGTQFPDVGAHP
ncbi:MAG: ice-binding family protein [Patescibacteria group bacterium]